MKLFDRLPAATGKSMIYAGIGHRDLGGTGQAIEMATRKGAKVYIDVGPLKKPYFVLFNHWRPSHATKMARIWYGAMSLLI